MKEFYDTNEYYKDGYQTGKTKPPKNYGGLIAFGLILAIFFCGIVNVLGMLDIHLVPTMETQAPQEVLLARCVPAEADMAIDQGTQQASLGITAQEITTFYQHYYDIPQGVYVSYVDSDSDCYAQGLRIGDVLTHFNETPITDPDSLDAMVQAAMPGDTVQLTIYRDGTQQLLTVTLDMAQ